jgi:hypothetical protein
MRRTLSRSLALLGLASLLAACGADGATSASGDASNADVVETTESPDGTDPADANGDASEDPGEIGEVEADSPPLEPQVALAFTAPAPGTYATDCATALPVEVVLAPADAASLVTIQGQAVTPNGGLASLGVRPQEGLNVLKAVAVDANGGKSREHRALLCGTYAPPETLVRNAADLYLGHLALAALMSVAADVFDGLDLTSGFSGAPVYENDLLRIDIVRIDHAPGTVFELVPGKGDLELELGVLGVDASFTITLKGSSQTSYDATVHADRLSAWATVALTLGADGQPDVELAEVAFDVDGLEFYLKGYEDDLLALLPSLRDVLVELLESMLASTLQEMLPPALEKGLARLSEPFDLELLGQSFQLRFQPSVIDVKPAGLHLALDLALSGLDPDPAFASPGVLWTPGNDEWKKGLTGFRLAVKDDLLNVVFHEAWRAGLLQVIVDQAMLDRQKMEIDLVAGFLGGILTRIPNGPGPETPIHLDLHPTFPPVASLDLPAEGGVRLGVGDLHVDVWADEWSWVTPLLPLTFTLRAEILVEAKAKKLATTIQAFDVLLDVNSDDPGLFAAETYAEPFADALFGILGPLLGDLLTDFPVPVPEGLVISSLRVGSNPENGGTLVIEGEVEPAP